MIKERILVVEDEQIIAFVIQKRLMQFGYEISAIASSSEEAVKFARELKPDLILMDIHLQGKVDGIQTAEEIKSFSDAPLIYLTAFSDAATLERAKLTQPAGFLVKPIDERELYTNVALALHKYKINKKLKESEERYTSLFNNSSDCIFIIEFQGDIVEANKATLLLTGYTENKLINVFDIIHPKEKKSLLELFTKMQTGIISSCTGIFSIRTIKNDYVQLETNYNVLFRDDKPYAVQGISRDVTEKKRAEEKIRKKEEHFRLLYEKAPLGYQSLDSNASLLDVNQKWLEIMGYSKQDVLGKLTFDFVAPEYRNEAEDFFETLKSGQTISGAELEMLRKNGEKIIITLEASASFDEKGNFMQAHCIMADVTEKKLAEEAIRRAQLDYQALVDSIGGIIWESGPDFFTNTFVSKKVEDILGYPAEMWMNDKDFWSDHLYEEDRNWVKALFLDQIEKKNAFDVQYRMINASGKIVWIKDIASVITNEEGKPLKLRGIRIDITKSKEVEEELRKVNVCVEQSPLSIIITDSKARIQYVNPKFSEVSGYYFNEVKGKNPRLLQSGNTPKSVYMKMWETISSGVEWSGEFHNKKKNGDLYWESVKIAPIKNNEGKITHYIALKEETTGVKIVEKFLIESEDRYRRLVEMSPDGIAIYSNGKIVYVNEAAARYMKAENKDALLGRDALSIVHPDYWKIVQERVQLMHDTKMMAPFEEEKFVDLNGGIIDVETAAIPTTFKGKPAVQIIARDITERKKAEFDLKLSEERFRAVFENSPIGITISVNRMVQQVNDAFVKMFGYESHSDVIGKDILEMIPHEYRELILTKAKDVAAEGKVEHSDYETFGLRRDGSRFPVNVEVAFLTLSQGRVAVALISDATEIVTREEQIKASLKEKEILLKEIHHRVKNNLQIISSLLSLQSEYIKDKQSLALFNDSRNRVKSMALIHERLYQSSDLGRIDFSEYIHELVGFLSRTYLTDSQSVAIEMDLESIYLSIDMAIPCGLIINELVSNSLKYAFPSGENGKIKICFKAESSKDYMLLIEDNGVGIPSDINFRETTSLGLQLVNNLVDQLKGTIDLLDEKGARFLIKFSSK
ncbi:MAG: PAS domain S-box protein [Bacteroidota bacterium]|nr:PAS domain S-box protein [Bacteroidota bacterium]